MAKSRTEKMGIEKTGSETLGSAGERSRMTLFRNDRQEDFGAILLSIVAVALIVVMTT